MVRQDQLSAGTGGGTAEEEETTEDVTATSDGELSPGPTTGGTDTTDTETTDTTPGGGTQSEDTTTEPTNTGGFSPGSGGADTQTGDPGVGDTTAEETDTTGGGGQDTGDGVVSDPAPTDPIPGGGGGTTDDGGGVDWGSGPGGAVNPPDTGQDDTVITDPIGTETEPEDGATTDDTGGGGGDVIETGETFVPSDDGTGTIEDAGDQPITEATTGATGRTTQRDAPRDFPDATPEIPTQQVKQQIAQDIITSTSGVDSLSTNQIRQVGSGAYIVTYVRNGEEVTKRYALDDDAVDVFRRRQAREQLSEQGLDREDYTLTTTDDGGVSVQLTDVGQTSDVVQQQRLESSAREWAMQHGLGQDDYRVTDTGIELTASGRRELGGDIRTALQDFTQQRRQQRDRLVENEQRGWNIFRPDADITGTAQARLEERQRANRIWDQRLFEGAAGMQERRQRAKEQAAGWLEYHINVALAQRQFGDPENYPQVDVQSDDIQLETSDQGTRVGTLTDAAQQELQTEIDRQMGTADEGFDIGDDIVDPVVSTVEKGGRNFEDNIIDPVVGTGEDLFESAQTSVSRFFSSPTGPVTAAAVAGVATPEPISTGAGLIVLGGAAATGIGYTLWRQDQQQQVPLNLGSREIEVPDQFGRGNQGELETPDEFGNQQQGELVVPDQFGQGTDGELVTPDEFGDRTQSEILVPDQFGDRTQGEVETPDQFDVQAETGGVTTPDITDESDLPTPPGPTIEDDPVTEDEPTVPSDWTSYTFPGSTEATEETTERTEEAQQTEATVGEGELTSPATETPGSVGGRLPGVGSGTGALPGSRGLGQAESQSFGQGLSIGQGLSVGQAQAIAQAQGTATATGLGLSTGTSYGPGFNTGFQYGPGQGFGTGFGSGFPTQNTVINRTRFPRRDEDAGGVVSDDDGRGVGLGDGDGSRLQPGYLSETVTALRGDALEAREAPPQSVLEEQPLGLRLTGNLPTEALLDEDATLFDWGDE